MATLYSYFQLSSNNTILSQRVEETRAGISIIEGSSEEKISKAFNDITSKQSFYTEAQNIARNYTEQFSDNPLATIVSRCEEIIGKS